MKRNIDQAQKEQEEIKEALLTAIPDGVKYKNLIAAMADLLKAMVEQGLGEGTFKQEKRK